MLFAIRNTIAGWRSTKAVRVDQINAVAVLYAGDAVMLGLNDRVWDDLLWPSGIAAHLQPNFESALLPGPKHGNPFYLSTASTADLSVEALSAVGVTFLLCNDHLKELAARLAPTLKSEVSDMYGRLAHRVVPGGLVVPTGVWAIAALQEAHFTYLQVNE